MAGAVASGEVVGSMAREQAGRRLRRAGGKVVAWAPVAGGTTLITSLATVAALDDAVDKIALAKRGATRPALIVIETSTLPIADKARALKRLQRAGVALLDCPISGTAVRMKEGAWMIFVSGSAAAYRRARPVLEVFTRNAPYVGAFGNGTKMKFIANHMVAIRMSPSASR